MTEDAFGLLAATLKEGILDRARRGLVPFGSRDFRVYTGLYVLAETLFQQADPSDGRAFDLYDALNQAWPGKKPEVTAEFIEHYTKWRSHSQFHPATEQAAVDLGTYRRVQEFLRSCQ